MSEELTPLQARVKEIVSQTASIPIESLGIDSDLKVEFNVDSLLGLEIVAAIEDEWGIEVPEDAMDIYTTVRSIAETVERLRGS